MADWEYGGAYKKYAIANNSTIIINDSCYLKVHDIFNDLPAFMHTADILFTDPPWNLGNLNTFYTKADKEHICSSYDRFYTILFESIYEINPPICYVEIGKQHLADFIIKMKQNYKYVTFFNSTYYHKKQNLCYVIRGANKARAPKLDNIDEENIIKWVCQNEDYNCIGDLCMGRGLVGLNAFINSKKFVGTELNNKRLAVLLDRLIQQEPNLNYMVI